MIRLRTLFPRAARTIVRTLLVCSAALAAAPVIAQTADEDLVIYAGNNHVDRVRELLRKGVKPDVQNARGETALAAAARGGNDAVIDVLIAGGADVNGRTRHGDLPISLAAYAGFETTVRKLRAAGAVIDLPKTWTPLIYAAAGGHEAIIRYLLAQGADINAGSPNGTTALMMAVREGRINMVELLLAQRADPNRRNDHGLSALDFARRIDDKSTIESLRRAGARD